MNMSNPISGDKDYEVSLSKIEREDQNFVMEMFDDNDIRNYYYVPNEIYPNFSLLIDKWENDRLNQIGDAWKMELELNDSDSINIPVGIIAIELVGPGKQVIMNIAVHPKYRKNGLGENAIAFVSEFCESIGAEIVFAEVDDKNIAGMKLFEKAGFSWDNLYNMDDSGHSRNGKERSYCRWEKIVEVGE